MAHAEHHSDGHHGHHVIPKRLLLIIFGALVFLTVVTVLTAQVDLGILNVPLALTIAFTKAGLVLTFFMALKYDNKVNTLVFAVGAVFVLIFLAFTLFDTALRGELGMMEAGTIADEQRAEEALRARDPGIAPPTMAAVDTTAATDPAAGPDGEALFTTYMCNTCHSLDGSAGAGPSLNAIGSQQSREEIIEAIREPDAVIAEGYAPGVMGATLNAFQFYNTITDEEFEALVDFLVAQTN